MPLIELMIRKIRLIFLAVLSEPSSVKKKVVLPIKNKIQYRIMERTLISELAPSLFTYNR